MNGDDDRREASERRAEERRAVEAMLFVAEEVLTADQIVETFRRVTGDTSLPDIDTLVDELNDDYSMRGSALRIVRWSGGYRLATRSEVEPYVQTLLSTERTVRLSRSLLETLAVIAYRQPVTRPEIEFVRGVDSDYAVRRLLEHRLVDVVGRADSLGRPLLYGTTPQFLEQFGIDTIDDLPTLREIEEILDDPAFDRERARLFEFQQQEEALSRVDATSESNPTDDSETTPET
jgi:segregation and condensation protein B